MKQVAESIEVGQLTSVSDGIGRIISNLVVEVTDISNKLDKISHKFDGDKEYWTLKEYDLAVDASKIDILEWEENRLKILYSHIKSINEHITQIL